MKYVIIFLLLVLVNPDFVMNATQSIFYSEDEEDNDEIPLIIEYLELYAHKALVKLKKESEHIDKKYQVTDSIN